MPQILIVDDNEAVRDFLRNILEIEGFEVIEAVNGDKGYNLFLMAKPELVITDVLMPIKDGIELVMEIRKDYPNAKILSMAEGWSSGFRDFSVITKKLGATAFFTKPIKRECLIHTISCMGIRPNIDSYYLLKKA